MAARATVTPRKPAKLTETTAKPIEERVRQRAYDLYLQRGGADGSEIDDWLQAEEEISAELKPGA